MILINVFVEHCQRERADVLIDHHLEGLVPLGRVLLALACEGFGLAPLLGSLDEHVEVELLLLLEDDVASDDYEFEDAFGGR